MGLYRIVVPRSDTGTVGHLGNVKNVVGHLGNVWLGAGRAGNGGM